MNPDDLDLNEATKMMNILGVEVGASKEAIRRARNRLLNVFHPDKIHDSMTEIEQHVYYIQGAYEYVMENYQSIQVRLGHLSNESLTTLLPNRTKAHWAYVQVASQNKDVID